MHKTFVLLLASCIIFRTHVARVMFFRGFACFSLFQGPPLEDLDCSYNSLDDPLSVVKSLASILRTCTRLSSLVLDHCFLPKDLFSPQHNFSMALKG